MSDRREGLSGLRTRWRAAAVGAVAAFVTLSAVAGSWLTQGKPKELLLLYVGADDCAPCRAWQRGEGARFRVAPEFAHIAYREVKSPALRDVLKDEIWPDDLRRYRAQLGPGAGVPMWLVIADDRVVQQSFGETQWRTTTLPKIRSLLR